MLRDWDLDNDLGCGGDWLCSVLIPPPALSCELSMTGTVRSDKGSDAKAGGMDPLPGSVI